MKKRTKDNRKERNEGKKEGRNKPLHTQNHEKTLVSFMAWRSEARTVRSVTLQFVFEIPPLLTPLSMARSEMRKRMKISNALKHPKNEVFGAEGPDFLRSPEII